MKNDNENDQTPHGRVAVRGQYVVDMSFENPRAPEIFNEMTEAPKINLNLNVNVKKLHDNFYEVMLDINSTAKLKDKDLFVIELKYAGIFELIEVPEDQKEMVLLIYCPSIIFPFARRIVSDLTRDGGFQPLMIDPIDFANLYQQRSAELAEGQKE